MPAHDLEQLVASEVSRLVAEPESLIERLAIRPEKVKLRRALLQASKRYAHEHNRMSHDTSASIVRAVLARVTLGKAGIDIMISRHALVHRLLGPAVHARLSDGVEPETSAGGEDGVVFHVPALLKRRGATSTLALPVAESDSVERQPNAALVNAVARGHLWAQQLITGEIRSLRALSELVGLSERYVSRIVRLGFLGPGRVRDILDGRQPPGIYLQALWNSPLAWDATRSQPGRPSERGRVRIGQ